MYIFFTDLDGTLLNDQKEITPKTKEAIDDFVAAGNHVVISTGRPTESAVQVQQALGLNYPGSYVCAYNGAVIYDSIAQKNIYETGISLDLVPDIVSLAESLDLHIHAYQGKYAVSKAYTDGLHAYLQHIDMPVILNKDLLSELRVPPWKLIAVETENHEKLHRFHDLLCAQMGDHVRPSFSGNDFIDIFPIDAGKGNCLRQLCRLLDVPVENSMAAGDEENDISMLEAAGLGIAMCNANEKLKAVADVITEADNNHDGLVPYLKRNLADQV